jgi:phosphotransferase system HPr-like phosphotransfer protein
MYKIRFKEINEVKVFVSEAINLENIDIIVRQDRYIVDGKSIMGIFSLNLLNDMYLEITGSDEEKEKFLQKISETNMEISEIRVAIRK